jgi:tetratricopeptide (TPR) repeat protein
MISVWLVIFGVQAVLRMFASMSAPTPSPAPGYRVTEANRADVLAQFNLGVRSSNAGDGPGAIAAFQRVVALDPTIPEAYFHLGTLMVGQNKVPEAIFYLEKYLAMAPANARNVAIARNLLTALKSYRRPKGVG